MTPRGSSRTTDLERRVPAWWTLSPRCAVEIPFASDQLSSSLLIR